MDNNWYKREKHVLIKHKLLTSWFKKTPFFPLLCWLYFFRFVLRSEVAIYIYFWNTTSKKLFFEPVKFITFYWWRNLSFILDFYTSRCNFFKEYWNMLPISKLTFCGNNLPWLTVSFNNENIFVFLFVWYLFKKCSLNTGM